MKLKSRPGAVAILAASIACTDGGFSTAPVDPPPPPLTGFLRISVKTQGSQQDPDGYVITINDKDTRTISPNGSIDVKPPAGKVSVSLGGIANNCWTEGDALLQINVPDVAQVAFKIICFPFTDSGTGSFPLGVWRMAKWEFFEHPNFTDLYFEMGRGGLVANLMLLPRGGSSFDWIWQESTGGPRDLRWGTGLFGPNTFRSSEDFESIFEAGFCAGDCRGPLHGEQNYSVSDDTMVVTMPDSVDFVYSCCAPDYAALIGPFTTWSRLTLVRRR